MATRLKIIVGHIIHISSGVRKKYIYTKTKTDMTNYNSSCLAVSFLEVSFLFFSETISSTERRLRTHQVLAAGWLILGCGIAVETSAYWTQHKEALLGQVLLYMDIEC